MKFAGLKKVKKRAVASVVAALTAVGVLLGGAFDSPAQLLDENESATSPVIIETLVAENDDDNDGGDDGSLPGEDKRRSLRARIRAAVMKLPVAVRAGVLLPLWCLGWLIISAVGLLWEPILSPLAATLVRCLCVSAIIAATLFLTVKSVFPEMSVKKILNRRSLMTAFFGALAFGAVGAVMQIFIPESDRLKDICEGIILLGALSLAAIPLLRRETKLLREEREKSKAAEPDEKKLIIELADSMG